MFNGELKAVKPHHRSLYLSAARSWLFNVVLSERVAAGNWNRRIPGDVFMLDGRSACFPDDGDDAIDQRLMSGDIHPTGMLWGQGESMAKADCLALEQEVASRFPILSEGLIKARLEQERRTLRVIPKSMSWRFETDETFAISFGLPAGSYATMVLRELFHGGDE